MGNAMQKDLVEILAEMLEKVSSYDERPLGKSDAEKMAVRILRSAFSNR